MLVSVCIGSHRWNPEIPGGTDAWLVRVVYEGGPLAGCAYIWCDDRDAAIVKPDEGCRHWKYG